MEKTADLLTYPLPFKGIFGIQELVYSSEDIDIVGVIGYTDFDDNPDQRFKQFWEDRKNLPAGFEVIPYVWGSGSHKDILTAFKVIDTFSHVQREITFMYGVNSPVLHEGKLLTLLRIGIDFNEKPHKPGESLEKVIKEATEQGSLILVPPETIEALQSLKSINNMILCLKLDGVYWDAQRIFGRRKKQEKIVENTEWAYPIVPVSNAHLPYFKEPLRDFMEEIGRSFIGFEEFEWKTGHELVKKIKERIRKGNYSSHKEYSSIKSILSWGLRMKARKFMKRTFKTKRYDFTWPEGSPLVHLPAED
ncbi:hypothetical protein HYX16_04015 [Candidatus Woesearchaeota archaeon]|nr:hypothetical protein [Candidatus Woesearchaeota archaeon]